MGDLSVSTCIYLQVLGLRTNQNKVLPFVIAFASSGGVGALGRILNPPGPVIWVR